MLLFWSVAPLSAQPSGAPPAATQVQGTSLPDSAAEIQRATVALNGEIITKIRGIASYPAAQRAAEISARIQSLAEDTAIDTSSIRLVQGGEDWTGIVAGSTYLLRIYDLDAYSEGISREVLAETIRQRVARVIGAYREARAPGVLLRQTLYAVGATLLLVLGLILLARLFRRLQAAVQKRLKSGIETLEARSFRLLQASQLWAAIRVALRVARVVLTSILVLGYLEYVLGLYPWTRPLSESFVDLLTDPLILLGNGFLAALPKLVFLVVLFFVTRYFLKLMKLFFAGVDRGAITIAGFDREWAWQTYKLVRFVVLAFAAVIAYPYIPGSDSDAFKGVSIFLGVIFSLGSSSMVANTLAGYTMAYRRVLRVGDVVKIGDFIGEVSEVRLLTTRIQSLKNEEVIVPNTEILDKTVVNYTTLAGREGLILHTTVGIGYETPWRQVEAMLTIAAERTPGILRTPPPFVLQGALGDFAVTYELNVFCADPGRMLQHYTELHRNILDVFNEYGVQIMTPAYIQDPTEPKVVPKERWFDPPSNPPPAGSGENSARKKLSGGRRGRRSDPG